MGSDRIVRVSAIIGLTVGLAACASHEGQVNDNYMYVPSRPPSPVAAPLPAPAPAPAVPTPVTVPPPAAPVPFAPPSASRPPPPAKSGT